MVNEGITGKEIVSKEAMFALKCGDGITCVSTVIFLHEGQVGVDNPKNPLKIRHNTNPKKLVEAASE